MAQYKLDIAGTLFDIELDRQAKTAALRDYVYKRDDAKYPVNQRVRKFKNLTKKGSKTVEIPSTYKTSAGETYKITTIGQNVFAGFFNVDHIVIPESVTTIEDYAFFHSSILSVDIPVSVTHLGSRAFGWCQRLKRVRLPRGIEMGNNLWAESKGVAIDFYESGKKADDPVSPVSVPEVKTFTGMSDVDVDLPTASRQNEEMFAVIIANEHYKQVPNVAYAHRDGQSVRTYCEQVIGVPAENITVAFDASRDEMIDAVSRIKRIAREYDGDAQIIIYYAGHGIPDDTDEHNAYLLPVGVAGDNTEASYSLRDLYRELGSINAKYVTLLMDACFSGSRGDELLVANRSVALASKAEPPRGNMVVFSAAQGDETAYPYAEQGHGYFTYYLLKKLKESSGRCSFGEMDEYVNKWVKRKTATKRKPQHPQTFTSERLQDKWQKMSFRK